MSSNRMTEGVGKKIVEALKQQSDIEIVPVKETQPADELTNFSSLALSKNLIDDMVIPQEAPQPAPAATAMRAAAAIMTPTPMTTVTSTPTSTGG